MSRRRALLTAAAVVAVVAILAVGPALPPVRGYLVDRVVEALEDGGTSVSFTRSEGNAWRGVTLHGASVDGTGIDVDVARVRVGYFLPSLLGGELPLDVHVSGARGSADLSELLTGFASGPAGPAGPISVQLRRLTLQDVEVDVQEAPFTLPDATVSKLEVTQDGTVLDLMGTVTTLDGEASLAGRFETITGTFEGRLVRADAAIARHWWDGIRGGELTGDLRVRGPSVSGDFVLTGATVDDIGLIATDVGGAIELDYPVITAEVTGNALGGPVEAAGVVNVEAMLWEAEANGAVGLDQAAGWLLRNNYPDGPPVDVRGRADVAINLRGWDDITLDGSATGAGEIEGVPLEQLTTSFQLPRGGRVRAEGTASLGGGPLAFQVGPGPTGERLSLTATNVDLSALQSGLGSVDAEVLLAVDGRDDGEVIVEWRGDLAGRDAQAVVEARLDPDGWQGFVSGSDETGAVLEGAVVLANGRLDGGVTLSELGLAQVPDSTRITVGVAGPADLQGARLTLGIGADEPITPGPITRGVDLRGSLAGTYRDGAVTGIVGRLGPAAVSGALDLDPLTLTADLIVEPAQIAAAGGVNADVTVPRSAISLSAAGLSWAGQVVYANVVAGPGATPDGTLGAELRVSFADPAEWRLTGRSTRGDLSLTADASGLAVDLAGLPVSLAGADPDRPVISGELSGQVDGLALDLTVAPTEGGQFVLPAELELAGAVAAEDDRLDLTGALGDLPVLLSADWSGPLTARGELRPAGEDGLVFTYDGASAQVALDGATDLGRLLSLVTGSGAPPAAMSLTVDLTGNLAGSAVTGLTGVAEVFVTDPVDMRLDMTGRGDHLALDLSGEAGGLPVSGSGRVDLASLSADVQLMTVDVGPAKGLVVTASGISGTGQLEGSSAGPVNVPDLPWSLDAGWTDGLSATVVLAGSEAELAIVGDELVVDGPLRVPVSYAGQELVVTAEVRGGRAPLGDLARVDLIATLQRPDGEPVLTATGTPADLSIVGDLPLGLLAAPLPEGARPTGSLAVTGRADAIARTLRAEIGDDVDLNLSPAGLRLTADEADLAPYLPGQAPTGLQARLDGALVADPETGWTGGLRAELALPGEQPVTAAVRLTGSGPALLLDVTATGPLGSTLSAAGQVAPVASLEGHARALDGAVAADLSLDPLAGLQVGFRSTEMAADPYFSLPPLTATLTVGAGDRGTTLSGDWVTATIDDGGTLTGGIDLAMTLLGEPARLRVDMAGTLSDPMADATLAGAGVRAMANGSPDSATAVLTLTEPAVGAALPAGGAEIASFITSPVEITANWNAASGWGLVAVADAEPPGTPPLALALYLAGEGATYSGELTASLPKVQPARPVLIAHVAGEGADLDATVDLAAVDYGTIGAAFGAEVDLSGTGLVELGTDPSTLSASVDLSGTIDGAEVTLLGSAPDDLAFTLRGPEADLAGRLAWHEERRVVMTGQLAGRPVDAWLELDDAFERGRLHVDLPGARLEALLTTGESGRRLASVTGTLSEGGVAGFAGDLEAQVVVDGALVEVTAMHVYAGSVPGLGDSLPLVVQGSGTLAPAVDLAGTVVAPMSEAVDQTGTWRLAGGPLEAHLEWLGLDATYAFGPGEVTLAATGDVSPALTVFAPGLDGLALAVEGPGLTWNRGAGFSGRLQANATGELVPVALEPASVTLLGSGEDLTVELAAGAAPDGSPLANLVARVPAEAISTGRFTADVSVSGEVEAAGELRIAGSAAELTLRGQGLSATGRLAAEGWSVEARLDELPIAELVPQLDDPTLSLALTGGSATGGIAVEDIVLASGESRLTGSASLDGRVRAALQAQVDLGDLDLGGTELRGVLRGPVVVVAPSAIQVMEASLTAQLDAAGVGVVGVPALVDGSLQVGGTLADPVVFALLTGREELRGTLRLEAAPARGRLDLRTDLAYGDVTTDIRANVTEQSVIASGSVRAGDAVLLIEDAEGGLRMAGAGRLEGWSAMVEPGLTGMTAGGPLSAVAPAVQGDAMLRLGSTSRSDAWLDASVNGLEVAGQPVGDLELTSASAGAPIDLRGDGITGRVDPMDQSWALSVDGLVLPADLRAELVAGGRGAEGVAEATVRGGDALGLDVTARLDLMADTAHLRADGSVLGGSLTLVGNRGGNGLWTGDVELHGAALPPGEPVAALAATGVLQGNQALPQLVLGTTTYASGIGAAAAGRLTIGPAGVTFDQTLALPTVSAPLRVQGRVAPGLDVTLLGTGTQPGQPRGEVRLRGTPEGLTATGALTVPAGPATVELGGSGASRSPRVTVSPAAVPDADLVIDLAASDLGTLVSRLTRDGLAVAGTGAAHGSAVLELADGPRLQLRGLGLTTSGFGVELSGPLTLASAELTGTLTLPLATEDPALGVLPIELTAADGTWRLASDGRLGTIDAAYDLSEARALIDVALGVPSGGGLGVPGQVTGGSVTARVAYDPIGGPTGTLSLTDVRLEPPAWGPLAVGAEATMADGRIGGAATLQSEAGTVTLTGDAPIGLIVPAMATSEDPALEGDMQVRLRAVELSEVPVLAAVAPHLTGAVSGVLQLRDGFVLGQVLAPELAVGDTALPITAQVSGPLSRVDVAVVTSGSLFTLTLADGTLSGLGRFERFPLDLLAEAVVGPSDVSTFLTGVARVDLPLDEPGAGYAALASEELTLERAGVVTQGDITLTYDAGALRVDRANFSGRGDWRASGVLSTEELDFELVAEEADFGPLLGIFPALAQYGVGADGSFVFRADGSLAQPRISFETEALGVQVAGTSYRLEDTSISIEGPELAAGLTLRSLAPVTGALQVTAAADVSLDPVALRAVDVNFEGDLAVPGIGRLEAVHGTITQDPQFRPFLALAGQLGSPFTVQGTLVPLDLRAGGTGLRVSYPGLLIADATVAADLRVRSEEGGVALGGVIRAEEVVLDPAAQAADTITTPANPAAEQPVTKEPEPATDVGDVPAEPVPAQEAARVEDDQDASVVPEGGVPPSPVRIAEPLPEPTSGALASLRFDDLRITAPQRVILTTSFASLEAALDLTLSGTGADPQLTGDARTLRGNLRFAGREFTLDRAIATFTANRGVLPELDVAAHTEFEKTRVLTGSSDVSFAAPDGRTFRVDLAFRGPVERTEDGQIRFDVDPSLSSDALIEVVPDPEAVAAPAGGGVRPLTEAELLTLVTLGRLELGSDLIGAGGLGGAVAQGALDTAVDVLLLGEFQNAMREALGLDVFEIRTSAISSLLEGDGDPFGVSVRLGGYLNPELFASYTIGTAGPDDPGFAVTNEVALEYALGPLDLEISGRLDLPMSGVLEGPRSELGLGLSYQLGGTVGLDLSTSLSTERSAVSFGVTFRW